ncbi:MAG: radical SAM family heme chaperone HemW [Sphingobacteriales bacterium]|nr:MAG: radical SAM family heme chaperone HemW [Sphingobacteriales bacterium]
MAGIYIHIPYCKQACIYCNFHFSTGMKNLPEMVETMLFELESRKPYLQNEPVKSIYFGGGTPSLLSVEDIEKFLQKIYTLYEVEQGAEITLEANPDDLSPEKLKALFKAGINRLSIGVQSFLQSDLEFLNRAHSAERALACIQDAQQTGFELITIDLIYGIPNQTDEAWLQNLHILQSLKIPHFSAYALTVEPKTVLDKWIKTAKSPPVNDENTARHFNLLTNWAAENNYEHYEISNFCLPGFYAKHNTAYWQGSKYIGIGPSAHSFNGKSRQWNVANNVKYLQNIKEEKPYFELEELGVNERYNEYIMTGLRTKWGCKINFIHDEFGAAFVTYLLENAKPYINQNLLFLNENTLLITRNGKLLADRIISDLFYIE